MANLESNSLEKLAFDALVSDINCVGVAASDFAKEFDKHFPANTAALKTEFDAGQIEPSRLYVFDQGTEASPRFIFNLPTKIHFAAPIKQSFLLPGIEAVVENAVRLHLNSIAVMKFDCIGGEITWEEVKLAFLMAFARVPQIRLSFLEHGFAEPPKRVTIFTDGGAEPNPGVGGYGVVLRFGNRHKELSAGFHRTTNNRMELLAAIVGLETLKEHCCVRLYSDSRYLVDAINAGTVFRWRERNWYRSQTTKKPVVNADLWERLVQACIRHDVEFVWVKGHAGIADNERCDQLASAAISAKEKLGDDEGYLKFEAKSSSKLSKDQEKQPTKSKAKLLIAASSTEEPTTATTPKRRGPKPKAAGDPCRHCATRLVRRETKKSNPNSKYYYTWHLYCESCHRIYHVEDAKVYRENS